MNSKTKLFSALGLTAAFTFGAYADPFEDGMRQAFKDYKAGNDEAVTEQLRGLLKLMDEKSAGKVGEMLPDAIEPWKGETIKTDSIPGGGLSLSRVYVSGDHQITVKVIKDSPLIVQLLPLLANEELIKLTNRKTHRIAGETAIMEGEHKLQVVVDERIYVELEGDAGTGETELVKVATKLGLERFAKLK